jgi:hypothetical protein
VNVKLRYAMGSDWTHGRARVDRWQDAAVRVYNRRMRAPHEPRVEIVAAIDVVTEGSYVVQFGYPSKRHEGGTRLTPRIVVRVE